NPPWLFRRAGDKFTMTSLMASGQRLGEKLDNPEFEQQSVPIAPGDILFLYTDGLCEGTDATGDMFGKKRARKVVEQYLSGGPKAVIEGLMQAFLEHNGGKPLDDDVTLAVAMMQQGRG